MPTILRNIRGTLILNNLKFTIILYKSCTIATLKYLGPLLLKNYVYIIAFTPNL